MHVLSNQLADGHIVGLNFRTGGGASKNTRAFVGELSALLTTDSRKPLIMTTRHEATALYRLFHAGALRDARLLGALRFADIQSYPGHLYFELQAGTHDRCNIALPEGGEWSDGRTPDHVARHELPVFDAERIERDISTLLDRWTGDNRLVDIAAPAPARKSLATDIQYVTGTDISLDPADWEPDDSRRGNSALSEKVRRLRRAFFGRETRAPIEGPAGRSLE